MKFISHIFELLQSDLTRYVYKTFLSVVVNTPSGHVLYQLISHCDQRPIHKITIIHGQSGNLM